MPKKAEIQSRRERFMHLYKPLQPRLERFVSAMTNDREETRDLVAETTLSAYEKFDTLRDERAFLSWIFTIASRLYKKRHLRERWYGSYNEEQARRIPDPGTSPEVSADVALLYNALAQLPEQQREAVVLFEIADLPLKKICEIQGTSLSGVKSRVTRGRQRLAKLLGVEEQRSEEATEDTVKASPQDNGNILYMNAA